MGWSRKPVWPYGHRGFESLPLRHLIKCCLWRGDRVVEGARLEIVCRVPPYRGFESLSLRHKCIVLCTREGGSSSVGRAPGSQSGGRGFDPHLLHQIIPESIDKNKNRVLGRARWGGSGALHPQSAIAGLNSRPEVLVSQVRSEQSSAEDRILRNKELLNPVRTGR